MGTKCLLDSNGFISPLYIGYVRVTIAITPFVLRTFCVNRLGWTPASSGGAFAGHPAKVQSVSIE